MVKYFAKFSLFWYIFPSDFCEKIFCANVCENVKTPIFVSTLAVRPDKAAVCRLVPWKGPGKKPSKYFWKIYHSFSLISFSWIAHLSCREVQYSDFFSLLCCTQFARFSDASEFFTGGRIFVKTGRKLLKRVDNTPPVCTLSFVDVKEDVHIYQRETQRREFPKHC